MIEQLLVAKSIHDASNLSESRTRLQKLAPGPLDGGMAQVQARAGMTRRYRYEIPQ